jgi:hypothetical protein
LLSAYHNDEEKAKSKLALHGAGIVESAVAETQTPYEYADIKLTGRAAVSKLFGRPAVSGVSREQSPRLRRN